MNTAHRTLTVFPDTNVFQHCRSVTDLPWFEEFDCDELQILIAATVIEELDRHKADGNSRRAQRARMANALFRRMLDDSSASLSFACAGKTVVIRFAPQVSASRHASSTLDRSIADDRLLEEVLNFSTENAGVLLSMDTGIELKARRNGVQFKRVPESWQLEPESDERDKQVRQLQARVAALEHLQPQIAVKLCEAGEDLKKISIQVPYYPALTALEVESLAKSVLKRHPCADSFEERPKFEPKTEFEKKFIVPMSLELAGVDKADIDKYRADYATWEQGARKHFARLPFLWNLKCRWHHFSIEVDNLGAVPAEHLLIEIHLHDGIRGCLAVGEFDKPEPYLLAQKISDTAEISPPPKVPRPMDALQKALGSYANTKYIDSLFPHIPDLSHMVPTSPIGRDRHALQIHEDEDKPLTSWSLDCEEFRHGRGVRTIGCWMIVPENVELKRSHIYLRATAKNMASSIELNVPIEIESTPCSSFELASQWTASSAKGHEELDPREDEDVDSDEDD